MDYRHLVNVYWSSNLRTGGDYIFMKKETRKGENYRRGFQNGFEAGVIATHKEYKDICKKCRGKGYGTSLTFAEGGDKRIRLPLMVFCECDRGKQLKKLIETGKL